MAEFLKCAVFCKLREGRVSIEKNVRRAKTHTLAITAPFAIRTALLRPVVPDENINSASLEASPAPRVTLGGTVASLMSRAMSSSVENIE